MPKEIVYGSQLPYGDTSSARCVIEVHWLRGSNVQVAAALFNDDLKALVGEAEVEASGKMAEMRRVWSQGLYVDLDRDGINRLIRSLRRARDQAFGRDE